MASSELILEMYRASDSVRASNPYDYFVNVLQRVGQHPASKVHELTPGLWKTLFAANPSKSDLYAIP
ncbi:hypothetical protein [Undibacterium sp. SXout20W]|uniref:hypothetical protein n=1 Tax=Undibacterium sp. SXout20W TaxID=3413051 RepID=UPI003BF0FADF